MVKSSICTMYTERKIGVDFFRIAFVVYSRTPVLLFVQEDDRATDIINPGIPSGKMDRSMNAFILIRPELAR